MKINRQNIQQNKKVQVNTLPAFIMTIFSSASSILLVKAMLNLRKISRQYTGIKETRFAISTYLILFTMELVLNCCWIPLQFIYSRTDNAKLERWVTFIHIAAITSAVFLGSFIAFVTVQLSQETAKVENELLGRKVNLIVQIKSDEALNQYLRRQHRP